MSLLNDCYISYLNLDHRTDRKEHIEKQLELKNIKAVRTRGKSPNEFNLLDQKLQVMRNRTAGAIGCHYGQVEIMQKALDNGKHAFVMEDDCEFCSDFRERVKLIDNYLKDKDWQIFWLGGTYHANNPAWWHKIGHSPDLPQCDCSLGVDVKKTDDKHFVQTYGCFSTHCYIVNHNFIESLLEFLEGNVHLSMGIDWLMILLQPKINTYAFVPGCVKQIDNMSDIGGGMTVFSGFRMLGDHWYQDKIEDFNYDNFHL